MPLFDTCSPTLPAAYIPKTHFTNSDHWPKSAWLVATNTIEGVDYENLSTIGNPSPFNYTRVPIDFNEWYFIVASYDPFICEDSIGTPPTGFNGDICSSNLTGYNNNSDYWLGNIDPVAADAFVPKSGYGAKCKVEIISKTD